MLDADDCAVENPLLSVNLVQMMSVLLRWQHVSVYKAKTVYSSLSLLLQKIKRAVFSCREKMLASSACVSTDDVQIEDVAEEVSTAVVSQQDGESSASTREALESDGSSSTGSASERHEGVYMSSTLSVTATTGDAIPVVSSSCSSSNVGVGEKHIDVTQNSFVTDVSTDKEKGAIQARKDKDKNEDKDKEEKEDNIALQMLIQMSCLISSMLGLAACALIEGNANTTVSVIAFLP